MCNAVVCAILLIVNVGYLLFDELLNFPCNDEAPVSCESISAAFVGLP